MNPEYSDRVVVYEPNQRANMGLLAGWIAMVRGVMGSKELIWQLFKRDFFANYKQSYLGVFWVFVSPVIGIVSWVFLNAAGVLAPGDVGVPYPVYVLIGSTVWGLFMSFYSNTSRSLIEYRTLIKQINFPHEVLVVKQIAQTVATFVINIGLILVVMLAFRVLPSWKIIIFPLAILPIMLVGAGIGMVIAVISAVANDVEKAVTALLGFAMYITPVIYAPEQKSELIRTVIYWNPLSYLVGGARDIVLYGRLASPAGYALSSICALLLFLFTWRLFYLSENKVAERL